MPSESDFLHWILERQRSLTSGAIVCPAGDDLAIARWAVDDLLLVGVDQVLDGVHFDSSVHSPRQIGRKAMNRNLSDCAAMACLPAFAVVSAALPSGCGVEFARELYLGIEEAGATFACPIIGGDTGSWRGKLAVSVTIIGRSAGIEPIRRNSAKVGDNLFVTGALGGSILGRHMTFEPRIMLARDIAATGLIHAMIDLSDGLSRDLPRLCEQSNVGSFIRASSIPIHDDARRLSEQDREPRLKHALNDGEDHELLFAADPMFADPRCIPIGRIVSENEGVVLHGDDGNHHPLHRAGWEHLL